MNRTALMVSLLLVFVSASAWAQSMFEPRRDPYRNLFAPPGQVKKIRPVQVVPAQPPRQTPAQPKVVCGMLVVPIDPTIDPKMIAKVTGTNQTFTMRGVTPPMCRPE